MRSKPWDPTRLTVRAVTLIAPLTEFFALISKHVSFFLWILVTDHAAAAAPDNRRCKYVGIRGGGGCAKRGRARLLATGRGGAPRRLSPCSWHPLLASSPRSPRVAGLSSRARTCRTHASHLPFATPSPPPQVELATVMQTEVAVREEVATAKLAILEEQEGLRVVRHKLLLKKVAVSKALQLGSLQAPAVLVRGARNARGVWRLACACAFAFVLPCTLRTTRSCFSTNPLTRETSPFPLLPLPARGSPGTPSLVGTRSAQSPGPCGTGSRAGGG